MAFDDIFSRNELYWGNQSQIKLSQQHVAIFGLGGVGGYCAEMLARSGVGELTIIDFDVVSKSNINRQIIALQSVVGQKKTDLFHKRLKDINPNIKLNIVSDFYTEDINDIFTKLKFDFIVDAIDTMKSKISLLEYAYNNGLNIISSLGAGNRINPEMLYICDIKDIRDKKATFTKNVLYQLKKCGITSGIMVVTSDEKPKCLEKINNTENITTLNGQNIQFNKITPASTPFVAPAAGIFMASYVVRKIIEMS